MFNRLLKKKQEGKEKLQPFYDEDNAVDFISKDSGVDRNIVRKVMNSDLRYQKSVGIIDWKDLEFHITKVSDGFDI